MGKRIVLMVALGVVLFSGTASAEEIVHFSNGTSMAVRSHELKDGMIHVDLGSNGFMAFPEYLVEGIEVAGKTVKLTASTNGGQAAKAPMIIASGSRGNDRPVRKPMRTTPIDRSRVEVDDNGVATVRPFAGSSSRAKRRMRVSGSSAIFGAPPKASNDGDGYRGTTRMGSNHVIGSTSPPGYGKKGQVIGMTRNSQMRRPTQIRPPAGSDNSGDESAGSGSDDD